MIFAVQYREGVRRTAHACAPPAGRVIAASAVAIALLLPPQLTFAFEPPTAPGARQPTIIQGNGGPDAVGYTWRDSNAPGGPTFLWVDINGSVANLGHDNVLGSIPIGFDFPFYGQTFKNVWI